MEPTCACGYMSYIAHMATNRSCPRIRSSWTEAATLHVMEDLIAGGHATRPGVYVLAGSKAIPMLAAAGYYSTTTDCHRFLGSEAVIYVGSASSAHSSVRKRVSDHLYGDSRRSTLRQTLGLLLRTELQLMPQGRAGNGGFHFGDGEEALTQWISSHLKVAFRTSESALELERQVQRALAPALNIKEKEWDPFARSLSARRKIAVLGETKPPRHMSPKRGGTQSQAIGTPSLVKNLHAA